MTKRMEGFLNSEEYTAWQKSFINILDFIAQDRSKEPYNEDKVYDLLKDFTSNHLFASIRLGSAYPKEEN